MLLTLRQSELSDKRRPCKDVGWPWTDHFLARRHIKMQESHFKFSIETKGDDILFVSSFYMYMYMYMLTSTILVTSFEISKLLAFKPFMGYLVIHFI